MKIGHDIFVAQGILDCQIDQLIQYSHSDPEATKFTSDPIRFANRLTFHQWQQQGRIIYTLSDSQKNLLGIIWFGQKDPPVKINANFTFAIRIYGSARGQGLSQEFMKIAFNDLLKNQKNSHITAIWLETKQKNFAATHVYQKFGFKKIKDHQDSVVMIWSPHNS